MNAYARNYHMRYCKVRGCRYREDWNEAGHCFMPFVYDRDPAKRGYRTPERRIVPLDLWTGAEVMPL